MSGKHGGNLAEHIVNSVQVPVRLRRITERDAEMAALVMALEYYADADQYRVVAEEQTQPMILVDRGKKARHALGQSGQRAVQVHHFLVQTERRVAGQKHRLAELEAEAKDRKDRLAASQARVARLEQAIRPCIAERPGGWAACRGCGMEWAPDREPFHQPDCWVVSLLVEA